MSNSLIDEKTTCNDCKYAIFEDYGYSNYTTEGTAFHCSKKAHPSDGFDRWFGEDERLGFAQSCKEFARGDAIEMDCDREAELTPEQRAIFDEWEKQ